MYVLFMIVRSRRIKLGAMGAQIKVHVIKTTKAIILSVEID